MLGNPGDHMRVEILRFRAVVDVKDLLPVPVRDTSLTPPTAAKHRGGQKEKRNVSHDAR
jgi:hypothetical protein